MAGKKDERDQLAEASQKSGPLFPKHPAGSGSTITEKLLKKRSVPEEHRHNTKAPAEKKSKQKDAADANKDIIPATTSGEDQSRQDAIIRDPRRLTSCNATQQLPDPESSHAHASTHLPPSDEVESVSDPLDVDARTADYWRSIAMQLTRGSLHYTRSPEPTDNELFIYVTALRSCLSLAEQSINSQSIMIMGDYLMQRNVLARLKGREDVSTSQHSKFLRQK